MMANKESLCVNRWSWSHGCFAPFVVSQSNACRSIKECTYYGRVHVGHLYFDWLVLHTPQIFFVLSIGWFRAPLMSLNEMVAIKKREEKKRKRKACMHASDSATITWPVHFTSSPHERFPFLLFSFSNSSFVSNSFAGHLFASVCLCCATLPSPLRNLQA